MSELPPARDRVITVHADLWDRAECALAHARLLLTEIPSAPSQAQRYELTGHPLRHLPAGGVLTDRETRVLDLISQGLQNQQIADELDLTLDTVKAHCSRIFRKLEARDRAHATRVAFEKGVLP